MSQEKTSSDPTSCAQPRPDLNSAVKRGVQCVDYKKDDTCDPCKPAETVIWPQSNGDLYCTDTADDGSFLGFGAMLFLTPSRKVFYLISSNLSNFQFVF